MSERGAPVQIHLALRLSLRQAGTGQLDFLLAICHDETDLCVCVCVRACKISESEYASNF